MASLLRVVLATCVIFAVFVCGRTINDEKDKNLLRQYINEQDVAKERHRRAPPGLGDRGNFGGQGQQQQFANPMRGNALPNAMNTGNNNMGNNNWAQQGGAGQFPAAGLQQNVNPNVNFNRGQPFQGVNQGQQGLLPQQGLQPVQANMQVQQNRGAIQNAAAAQQQLQNQYQGNVGQGQGGGPLAGQGQHGKQLAKDMRQRKQQLANAMRPLRIADTQICKDDVMTLCGKNARGNNFAVLDCLQNARQDNSEISVGCNHFLWEYKLNLTKDSRFDSAAFEVCKEDLGKFPDCKDLLKGEGVILPCLYEVVENVTNTQCRQYLNRMKAITFSDYRLIQGFYDECREDILDKKCGSVQDKEDEMPHRQGETIQCLEKKVRSLQDVCKKQILRVAELSANDYHLDRALYFACKDDRERFCEKQQAGSGRVYKCLLKHKFEEDMSDDCKEKLTTRQQVIAEDYKANYALQRKCKEEIRKHNCRPHNDHKKETKLSYLLVCLEAAKKRGKRISGECDAELIDTRRSLMSDYLINPEVVFNCRNEIKNLCDGGLQREGRTLHCLMEHAKENKKLGPSCVKALEDLVKETDAGEDYRIDPALQRACEDVRLAVCKDVTGGDGKILSCLMEHIYDDKMTTKCETQLLELQYFVSRDFKLDPLLFKNCETDAKNHCGATDWGETDDPGVGIVFACLHRNLHPEVDPDVFDTGNRPWMGLSPGCEAQVHRTLRQRALSVQLNPRIEMLCRQSLGEYCTDKSKKGEEMLCLQDHFKDLTQDCKFIVGNFTLEESEDIRMNRILMQSCSPMLKKFCRNLGAGIAYPQEELRNQVDEGGALQCLIEHKDDVDMDKKCAAGVEHFQLLQLKDYRFNFKFKESCRKDVLANCKGKKDKGTIVECLSGIVRDDILKDVAEQDHTISEECRKQLKVELLERSENIKLDPELFHGCESDIQTHCAKVTAGNARVLECLREHKDGLSDPCHRKLFNREKIQAKNPDTDFAFMHACKPMIKQFCTNYSPDQLLKCLRAHKSDPAMDPKCKSLITKRQIEKNTDFRLNMEMQKSCRRDMPKFCKEVMDKTDGFKDTTELEGEMMACLKKQFLNRQKKLSPDCESYVREAIEEGAMDYRMDPALKRACKQVVQSYCKEELTQVNDDTGAVEECLKQQLENGILKKFDKCQTEVIRILQESRADVQVDPILHKACALDIKHYCANIPQGEGRHMSCLLEALEDKTIKLHSDCTRMLTARKEMWEFAAKVAPAETMNDIILQMQQSPSRNYFLLVFLAVFGTLFFCGMFCGRATKRVAAQVKNK